MKVNDNIIVGLVGFNFGRAVVNAAEKMISKNIRPTHLFFGLNLQSNDEDYIKKFGEEKGFFLRFRWYKSLKRNQFILIGRIKE